MTNQGAAGLLEGLHALRENPQEAIEVEVLKVEKVIEKRSQTKAKCQKGKILLLQLN